MVSLDFFGFAAVLVALSFDPVEEMERVGTGFFAAIFSFAVGAANFVATGRAGLANTFAGAGFTATFAGTPRLVAATFAGTARRAAGWATWTGAGFGAVVKFWMITGTWAGAVGGFAAALILAAILFLIAR